uniref:Uncharacterized protein n=1 Tax=Anguilla anguilla TaxID=7936 RepID=A0A0E9TSC0_ANGAN
MGRGQGQDTMSMLLNNVEISQPDGASFLYI